MKKRIISAAIGILLLIGIMWKIDTFIFVLAFSVLSAIASLEVNKATGVKNKLLLAVSFVFAAFVPINTAFPQMLSSDLFSVIIALYIFVLFLIMIKWHETIKFENIGGAIYGSIFVPFCLSLIIRIGNAGIYFENKYTKQEGLYLAVFAFMCCWLTDTFAYFVGRKFGKHKLCPKVSPKKTVEGAIGGFVLSVVFNVLVYLLVDKFMTPLDNIPILFIIISSFVLAIISMFGDLSASIIKRNYSVKDFGNIMPGHGGVLDRFDSCIFVLPTLYLGLIIVNSL